MRVLMLHNRYMVPGGEDESTCAEEELLRLNHVEVQTFYVDNSEVKSQNLVETALQTTWCQNSYREVQRRVHAFRPDVVHVQNFFPRLSPAVYYAAKHEKAAVVQTLRNYRLLCPNAVFFRGGRVCEDCSGKLLAWPGVLHRCYRGSALATSAVAAMLSIHKLFRTWSTQVDVYIALTPFARDKFILGGLPENKLVVKPNFAFSTRTLDNSQRRRNFFYSGRLSPEKGVSVLLDAWRRANISAPLVIAGSGPLYDTIAGQSQALGIECLGHCDPARIPLFLQESICLVFPSLVYEGMPRTIIEAFASGAPVIASRIGAASTMINHGVTGLHFEPGNAADLAAKVEWAWNHPEELLRMGCAARREYEAKYTPERNYQMLMDIYRRAIASKAQQVSARAARAEVTEQ